MAGVGGRDGSGTGRSFAGGRRADVVVVGGGVAGASLGAALAAAGVSVVVVEREARFRDRIRGEALHPWGAAEAARLGLVGVLAAAGARPLPTWQRYEGRVAVEPYRWERDVADGHVEWGVPHPALQAALLVHAARSGAVVRRQAAAVGYRPLGGGEGGEVELAVDGGRETVRARLVVGAGGTRAAARRWVGAGDDRDPTHHVIGGCLLEGVALDRESAHQAYLPGAMVTLFPQGNGADGGEARARARGYLVCDPGWGETFRGDGGEARFVAALAGALPERALAAARPVGPLGFFPGVDDWADRGAGSGIVLVGDAAGANDPSQGHGLSLAFRDARELRDRLLATPPPAWSEAEVGEGFAARRRGYAAPLRAHARWAGLLTTEQGAVADERRARVVRAREADPTAGGYAGIFAFGPDGLATDEGARRRFFGEAEQDDALLERIVGCPDSRGEVIRNQAGTHRTAG